MRQLLAKGRRAAHKSGERPRKKTAIPRTELEALAATCDDSLTGLRDRALLYFAFSSGGRGRSEVAAADMADLRRLDVRTYIYRLEHGKTLQDGPKATSAGAIFRRLWGTTIGPGLSSKSWLISCRSAPSSQAWRVILAGIACAQASSPKGLAKGSPCPP